MENRPPESIKELFDFMLNKLGGEDSVKGEFFKTKISSMDTATIKMGELLGEADRDGWGGWMRGLSLAEFTKLLVPEQKAKPLFVRSGKRMTAVERDELHRQILAYLGDHPWSISSSVSTEIGLPTRTIGLHLKMLRETGHVKTEGRKAQMRYALK